MNEYLAIFTKNIGLLGILLSLAAIFMRLLGKHYMMGVEAITVLQGGIALMLVSCVVNLNYLNKR